jgi:hypothetical protein
MTLVALLRVMSAIASTTTDPLEQGLLWSTGLEESAYREDVISCRVKGDHGAALGAWQVHSRSTEESKALCQSLESSARVALSRIRESIAACASWPTTWRLSAFASGRCDSDAGQRISRRRWALAVGWVR